jgi:signal transduction histidine kinase
LSIPAEHWLNLSGISGSNEIGYMVLTSEDGARHIAEIFAVPIVSTTRFRTIAALVVGFPFKAEEDLANREGMRVGVWIDNDLLIEGFPPAERAAISAEIPGLLSGSEGGSKPEMIELGGVPYRVALRPLNPGSAYPLVHEVFLASMAGLDLRQQRLRGQIFGAAAVLVFLGFIASHFLAQRLARPVEALAEASEEEHFQRVRAEEALDQTSRELERAARFSADASHQLKTPVTVMRLGLEELLVDRSLPIHVRQEVNDLIRQTGRLSNVINDLLLLSRLDAGRLELSLKPENLRVLIDGLLDDLSILPEAGELDIEVDVPNNLVIEGDRTYTSVILQNLLENARKYNRPGGRIRIEAKTNNGNAQCRVGNTGSTIPPDMRSHIFERFHRGAAGENVSGYGLGLNLAHELARLHGGQLSLLRSENDWTEFELTLRLQTQVPGEPKSTA